MSIDVNPSVVTRALADEMSNAYPHLRIEISAEGALEATVTPAKFQHGNVQARLCAWLAAAYGWDRVATEAGISVSRTSPDPYRQVDVALFRSAPDPQTRYHDAGNVLAVIEVLSTSTEHIDRQEKPVEFAALGIPHFWLVDPDPATGLGVHAYTLAPTGCYVASQQLALGAVLGADARSWLEPARQ